jgi:hypothetical protein
LGTALSSPVRCVAAGADGQAKHTPDQVRAVAHAVRHFALDTAPPTPPPIPPSPPPRPAARSALSPAIKGECTWLDLLFACVCP